jgi:hypothetical protein
MVDKARRAELDAELTALNAAFDSALQARREWMDAHMADYAKHPIGTEVFTPDGEPLGVVKSYYRYHAEQNPIFDRSMEINYRFEGGDNTSSRMLWTLALCDRAELSEDLRLRADYLARTG